MLYNRCTMADLHPVDDLGIDWALGARRYDYPMSRAPVYAEVTRGEEPIGLRLDYHQGMEFGVVLSGRVERHWDSFTYQAEPGDVWMATMWEPHGVRSLDPEPVCVVVIFLPGFLGGFAFDELSWLTVFAAPPAQRPRVSTEEQRARVLTWAGQMRRDIEQQPPRWITAVRLGLINILFEICRDWHPPGRRDRSSSDPHTSLARIMPALDLLRERGPSPVTLEEAARACDMSRTTLNRFFRQATGVSFGKLRMRARLAHAAHRLLTTDATADIIAREAGFSDGSHLHRLFVRHYGQTPGQYRTRGRRAPSQR
jgi:AraC-like DNA-binding protein/mannose-6-phosphate isomerase-like protein (cupin superfamily)